jgi:hypothetical protein
MSTARPYEDAPDYRRGEMLRWECRANPSAALMRRSVLFQNIDAADPGVAVVAFGLSADGTGRRVLHRAPLAELKRPLNGTVVFPPPTAPPKPSLPVARDLAPLREALKAAVDRRGIAQGHVNIKLELVGRAEQSLARAEQALRDIAGAEQVHARAVEDALRSGAGAPTPVAGTSLPVL